MTQPVELPDGTRLEFPDGMSQEDMSSAIQKNFPQFAQKKQDVVPGREAGAKGGAEALLSVGTEAVKGVAGTVAGLGQEIFNSVTNPTGFKADIEGQTSGAERAKQVQDWLTKQGMQYTPQDLAGKRALARLQGVFSPIAAAGKWIGEKETQGLDALGYNQKEQERLKFLGNIAAGAVAPGAALKGVEDTLKGAGKAAGAVGKALTPTLSPEALELAKKAQAAGIKLRPDMLLDNKFVKMAGEFFENMPLAGGAEAADARQVAFNKWIIKSIGGDAKASRLTSDVYEGALQKNGKVIQDTVGNTNHYIDMELRDDLREISVSNNKYNTPDVRGVVNNYIEDLFQMISKGQKIEGPAMRRYLSELNKKISSTTNGDLKHSLTELRDKLLDFSGRNVSSEELEAYHDARANYARAKTLEPLVAKSTTGDISPAAVMARGTSNQAGKTAYALGRGGDLQDIAKVGQQFLKEPKSSGTAERNFVIGALTGAGQATKVAAAGGVAYLYNKFGPVIAKKIIEANEKRRLAGLPPAPEPQMPGMPPRKPYNPPPAGLQPNQLQLPGPSGAPQPAPGLPPPGPRPFSQGYANRQAGGITSSSGKKFDFGEKTLKSEPVDESKKDMPTMGMAVRDPETGEIAGGLKAHRMPDGKIMVSSVNVTEKYQRQGLAVEMYRKLNEKGTLKPDPNQSTQGAGLWAYFKSKGWVDKNGEIPRGTIK